MLQSVEMAISSNSQIAMGIFENAFAELTRVNTELGLSEVWHDTATAEDCRIARACIRGLLRDWSIEGAPERNATHTLILNVLREEFGHLRERSSIRVLVPGAGLGRFLHSVSELGLSVEGIDVSYHTLLSCLYLFGGGTRHKCHTLYPWSLSFSNHVSRRHQFQSVIIPDLHLNGPVSIRQHTPPAASGAEQQTVFIRGGFVETYGAPDQAGTFSALVTCFFIDTAPNVLNYVNTAWNCLQSGGIWVNIGPLLWNIEENGPAGNGEGDIDGQESWKARAGQPDSAYADLELTAEELIQVVQARGFTVEKLKHKAGTSTYVGNELSMLQYIYGMDFWVARKPGCIAKL